MAAPRRAKAEPAKSAHPGDPCDAPRLETYGALRDDTEPVTVHRCIECGASRVE